LLLATQRGGPGWNPGTEAVPRGRALPYRRVASLPSPCRRQGEGSEASGVAKERIVLLGPGKQLLIFFQKDINFNILIGLEQVYLGLFTKFKKALHFLLNTSEWSINSEKKVFLRKRLMKRKNKIQIKAPFWGKEQDKRKKRLFSSPKWVLN
jgi:hypothetical protein